MAKKSRTKRTARKKDLFLAAFQRYESVSQACRATGLGRTTVYGWREQDQEFADAWDELDEFMDDDLEASVRKRATVGWKEPVFHEGAICGYKRRFSDTLSWRMLEARRPEKYRVDRSRQLDLPAGTGVLLVRPVQSDDEWIDESKRADAEREQQRASSGEHGNDQEEARPAEKGPGGTTR